MNDMKATKCQDEPCWRVNLFRVYYNELGPDVPKQTSSISHTDLDLATEHSQAKSFPNQDIFPNLNEVRKI